MPANNHAGSPASRAWRAPTTAIRPCPQPTFSIGQWPNHAACRSANMKLAESAFERAVSGERFAARLYVRDRRERSRACR